MSEYSRSPLSTGLPPTEDLLQTVLNTSQNGIMLLRPVYDAVGTTIVDLAWAYLNPAAQQMLRAAPRGCCCARPALGARSGSKCTTTAWG